MPLSAKPPAGPVTLSSNARTVLAKRYLVKDKTGAAGWHAAVNTGTLEERWDE